MNSKFNLIYLIIVFILVIIVSYVFTPMFTPDPNNMKLEGKQHKYTNLENYLVGVYGNDSKEVINDIVNHKFYDKDYPGSGSPKDIKINIPTAIKYFNFLYETAPNEVKDSFVTARNTTVSWPPKYNEKYRLTSFPYVSGNIVTGLYQTLSNKPGGSTMPTWYISKYDPNNYNNSLYNKVFDKTHTSLTVNLPDITFDQSSNDPLDYYVLKTFFGDVVEYETTPLNVSENQSRPEYDKFRYKTGGYILHHDFINLYQGQDNILNGKVTQRWDKVDLTTLHQTTINGILEGKDKYNRPTPKSPSTPNTCKGTKYPDSMSCYDDSEAQKVFSIHNQNYYLEVQHTCFPIPGQDYPLCDDGGWWTYLSVGSGIYWNAKRPIIAKNKLHLLHCCGWQIDDFVDITKGYGGGKNLVQTVLTAIYNNEHPKNTKPNKGLGLRTMEGKDGDKVVRKFFLTVTLFLFLIIYLMIVLFKNFIGIFKELGDKSKVVAKTTLIVILLIIIFTLLWYLLYVSINDFFVGLGWMTLDMALEKTNMSPYEFFDEAIFGRQSNPICNGLNITEWFDYFLYDACAKKGFFSAIMTMQPNKGGNWTVEMFDLQQYLKMYNAPAAIKDAPKLGLCGNQQLASGSRYYSEGEDNVSNNETYPTITNTVPAKKYCTDVSDPEKHTGSECEEKLDKMGGKVCNIYGCQDTNKALCLNCESVQASDVCMTDKKITYKA